MKPFAAPELAFQPKIAALLGARQGCAGRTGYLDSGSPVRPTCPKGGPGGFSPASRSQFHVESFLIGQRRWPGAGRHVPVPVAALDRSGEVQREIDEDPKVRACRQIGFEKVQSQRPMKAAAIIAFADFAVSADWAGGFAVKFSHAVTAVGTLVGGIFIKEISLRHVQEARLPGELPQLEIEAQPVRFAAPLVMVIEKIPALTHRSEEHTSELQS